MSAAFCAIGGILMLSGALYPRCLVLLNRAWMALAELMSYFMTRVILLLVFALAITPIGIVRRLFGADPLRRRAAREDSHWHPFPERVRDPRHYEKMF